jgi:hypothetical protein
MRLNDKANNYVKIATMVLTIIILAIILAEIKP